MSRRVKKKRRKPNFVNRTIAEHRLGSVDLRDDEIRPPARWRHHIHVQRGGWFAAGKPPAVDLAGAWQKLCDAAKERRQALKTIPVHCKLWRKAKRRFLKGARFELQPPEVEAATAAWLRTPGAVDLWVAGSDLPFAVEAFVGSMELGWADCELREVGAPVFPAYDNAGPGVEAARRLRLHLARCDEASWRAAKGCAAELRSRSWGACVGASYLFPDDAAWQQDAWSVNLGSGTVHGTTGRAQLRYAACSDIRRARQLLTVRYADDWGRLERPLSHLLPTLVEQHGTGILYRLVELRAAPYVSIRRLAYEALAAIPHQSALDALEEHAGHDKHARDALQMAAASFPQLKAGG